MRVEMPAGGQAPDYGVVYGSEKEPDQHRRLATHDEALCG